MRLLSSAFVTVVAGVALATLPALALAMGDHSGSDVIRRHDRSGESTPPAQTPEIVPGLIPGVLAAVGGGLLIFADRRRQ
jgi:hypothetical protein